jgi:peptide/nickel transport system substrate-binding protein
MSLITEEAPAHFMWRHKLLWGLSKKITYKPLPDARIYGLHMKVR